MKQPATVPDPSWDYYQIWQELSKAAFQVRLLHEYLSKAESASETVDRAVEMMTQKAVRCLKEVLALQGIPEEQEVFQTNFPTFIKIGNRVINPALVTAFYFDEIQGEATEEPSVEVWFDNDSSTVFYDKEAEMVKSFLMLGNRTYDLNNLFN